jgi:TetR/AcrR family transcriptional repressor of nem operon
MMNTTLNTDSKQRILHAAAQIIGKKGFAAVGLNEVLLIAKVPKGSFYHYFSSKDAFGQALLESYFQTYLAEMDGIFQSATGSEREKLMTYWQRWLETQTCRHDFGKCLVVKLGAEVADLSESMRRALDHGTAAVIARLAAALSRGVGEGSFTLSDAPERVPPRRSMRLCRPHGRCLNAQKHLSTQTRGSKHENSDGSDVSRRIG